MIEQMDFSGRKKPRLREVGFVQGTPESVASSDALPCEMNSGVTRKRGMVHAYYLQQQIRVEDNVSAPCNNGFKTKLVVREKNSVLGSVLHPIARDGVHAQVCSAHSRLYLHLSIRRLVEQGSSHDWLLSGSRQDGFHTVFPAVMTTILYPIHSLRRLVEQGSSCGWVFAFSKLITCCDCYPLSW